MGEKIITIAKIVIALIFVVILAVFMSTITSKGNSANTKLVDTLEMTDNTSLNSYKDGESKKGEVVRNAISNVKSIGGDNKLALVVLTSALTGGSGDDENPKVYGYVKDEKSPIPYSSKTSSQKASYINTGGEAEFSSRLIQNKNGVIVGIMFWQELPEPSDGVTDVDSAWDKCKYKFASAVGGSADSYSVVA